MLEEQSTLLAPTPVVARHSRDYLPQIPHRNEGGDATTKYEAILGPCPGTPRKCIPCVRLCALIVLNRRYATVVADNVVESFTACDGGFLVFNVSLLVALCHRQTGTEIYISDVKEGMLPTNYLG